MDAKSLVAFISVALMSSGLAGCIEAAGLLNTSDLEVTALDNKALADAAASEWNAKATLVSVMAFELSESDEAEIQPDPEVGNGLAPAWWYVYCAEGDIDEVRAFKVAADGTVTSEDDAAAVASGYEHHDMAGSLADWKVDSDDALAAAKSELAFQVAAEGFNATVVEGVANYEGKTSWWFAAISAEGFVVATVDAVTGELVEVAPIDMDMTMPTFEWGARSPEQWVAEPIVLEGEGEASAGSEPLELPFETTAPMHGILMLDVSTTLPTEGLYWAIVDEEGEEVEHGYAGSWRGHEEEMELEIDEPGDYTFVLYHASYTGPIGLPIGGVEYAFHLELMPGHMEHEDEDHDEP